MATVPQFPAGTLSRSALNTFVTETTTNLTDANIAAGANIAISKTALGTYTAPTTYTPTWTTTGTVPSIGNGTFACSYLQVGKLILVSFQVNFGSTTTYGTGAYRFSLPVAASTTALGACVGGVFRAVNNGVGEQLCFTTIITTTTFGLNTDLTGNNLTQSSPFTFGTGDYIQGTLTYEAA